MTYASPASRCVGEGVDPEAHCGRNPIPPFHFWECVCVFSAEVVSPAVMETGLSRDIKGDEDMHGQ